MLAFYATAGLTLYIALAVAIARWPVLGLAITTAFIVVAYDVPEIRPIVSIGGMQIHLEDLFCAALLPVALAHFISRRFRRVSTKDFGLGFYFAWAIFSAAILLSVTAGLRRYPFGAVVAELRPFLYGICIVLWLSLAATRERINLRRWIAVTGWALCIVCAAHIGLNGLGNANVGRTLADGSFQSSRPLVSGQSLFLAAAAVYFMALRSRGEVACRKSTPLVFLAVVIISQNRSAWAAASVGLAVLLITSRQGRRGRMIAAGLLVIGISAVALEIGALGTLKADLRTSLSSSATYDARVDSWHSLLQEVRSDGAQAEITGLPFGHGYQRQAANGQIQTFAPHNWYVSIYLRSGLIGLASWCWISILMGYRSFARKVPDLVLPLLAVLLVYEWTYTLNWYLFPFIAVALHAERPRYRQLPDNVHAASATARSPSGTLSAVAANPSSDQ